MKKTRIQENRVKKIASDVDNCPGFSEKRYQMICQIQEFLKEGCSYREIAKRMGISLSQAKTIAESQDDTLSINYTTEEGEDNNIEEVLNTINALTDTITTYINQNEKE